jgi:hypothetical protein
LDAAVRLPVFATSTKLAIPRNVFIDYKPIVLNVSSFDRLDPPAPQY